MSTNTEARTSPLAALAAAIGGTPGTRHEVPVIHVPGGFIYGGLNNQLRLDRLGHSVVNLGPWGADVETLAEAYRAATA